MRIRIPIHPAFLEDGVKDINNSDKFIQNETSFETSLKQVLKQSEYKKLEPIIRKLAQENTINIQDVMLLTEKSRTTAWRYMQILVSHGVVEVMGSTNNIVYKVCKYF